MRKRVILAVCLVCVSAYGFAYIRTFGFFPGKDLKRIQALQLVVAQNVKPGDPPERVIRFLDAQQLEHSTLEKNDFMRISGHDYGNQNVITALKRHVASSLLWDEAVEFVFVFNEKHELAKFDVMPVFTSF
jgi:uncharacterized protein YheU (UPF0270 family)